MSSAGLSDWSASAPGWGSVTCLWAIQLFFFKKKTQLRNKVKIIYTTKQDQEDCPGPTFMLVFIHNSGPSFASHKRHLTREWICLVDCGPAPSAISPKYEKVEGRFRFEVLFIELGTILHIHIPSTINIKFPILLKLSKKELTSLWGTPLIAWAIHAPTTGGWFLPRHHSEGYWQDSQSTSGLIPRAFLSSCPEGNCTC